MDSRKTDIDLSIVIVNYKTPDLLLGCVRSIYKETQSIKFEIIVVDNNSEDESKAVVCKEFPDVKWFALDYNSGFSRGNNYGIRRTSGNYILLLNSDTVILENAINKTLDFYRIFEKKNNAGLVGCQMKDEKGNILPNSNIQFPGIKSLLKKNAVYFKLSKFKKYDPIERHLHDHESQWLGAAFVLFNADLIHKNNLFLDEDFFLYSEDIEWCYRIIKAGFVNYFYSEAVIIHFDSGSSSISDAKLGQMKISEWLYILKKGGPIYYITFLTLLRINLMIDNILYFKAGISGKRTEVDNEERERRIILVKLLRKYRLRILFKYSRKISSAKQFLKYDS